MVRIEEVPKNTDQTYVDNRQKQSYEEQNMKTIISKANKSDIQNKRKATEYIIIKDEGSESNSGEEIEKSKNQREVIESKIRIKLELFKSDKTVLEESFNDAILNYPESVVLKKYKEDFERIFKCEGSEKLEEENIQDIMHIGKETQEFLMGECLTTGEEVKGCSPMNSSDSDFWSDPRTHGEVDLLYQRVEAMKAIERDEIARNIQQHDEDVHAKKFIERLNEEKAEEYKSEKSMKVEFDESVQKRNGTETEKLDKCNSEFLTGNFVKQELVEAEKTKIVVKSLDDSPSFSLGMGISLHEKIDESAEGEIQGAYKSISAENENIQKEMHDENNKEKHKDECLNKKTLTVSNSLKTPKEDMVIDIKKYYTSQEKRLTAWLFVLTGDSNEIIYETPQGTTMMKGYIESLMKDTYVSANVVDSWAAFLNTEEESRSDKSAKRLFLHTAILPEDLRGKKYNEGQRFKIFKSNIRSALRENADLINLRKFDLIFFPVLQSQHFFLIVYDLKNPRILVIDNMSINVSIESKYGILPHRINELFVQYLRFVNHPKADVIGQLRAKRYIMAWCNMENQVDCGIFVMRHMETYNGEHMESWTCGLDSDFKKQKNQINRLRNKYAAKMLLSRNNIHRNIVIDEMDTFDQLDETNKKLLEELSKKIKSSRQAVLY